MTYKFENVSVFFNNIVFHNNFNNYYCLQTLKTTMDKVFFIEYHLLCVPQLVTKLYNSLYFTTMERVSNFKDAINSTVEPELQLERQKDGI